MASEEGSVSGLGDVSSATLSEDSFSSIEIQGEFSWRPERSKEKAKSSSMTGVLQEENKSLKSQLRQLQNEYQAEQDTVAQLRRRLTTVERDKLDAATRANEEVADRDGQIARLRAQLEKGEAVRHNLEFELTKAQTEASHKQRSAGDREGMMAEINESLKQKLSQQNIKVEELESELHEMRNIYQQETGRHRMSLEEKEHLISTCRTEQTVLEAEKEKLQTHIQQLQGTIADLNEKVNDVQDEKKGQTELVRQHLTQLDYAKERNDRLNRDLESALDRVKTLESNIEAERAAHLESKFNSEIVQLRVRDLESALDGEKVIKGDLGSAAEKLGRQLKDAEQAYNEERKMSKHLRDKVERLEKDTASIQRQLSEELKEKKNVISKMSKQLDLHQRNFDELKDELNRAKKRQIFLEETYGGSMRELELLFDNFQLDQTTKKKKKKERKESHQPMTPSDVLENLRHTLNEYKKKLDVTANELNKMKSLSENLTTEVESYKDLIWAKDKALEETQGSLSKMSKELNRLRQECGEVEGQHASLKVQLQTVSQNYENQKEKLNHLNEELAKKSKKHTTENEDRTITLHNLYQRLVAGQVLVRPDQTAFSQYTYTDLTALINDQVSLLFSTIQRSEEKVHHLENLVKSKEDMIEQLQRAHEEQVDKVAYVTQQREDVWLKQKTEMEEHYNKMLAEIHTRSRKTQALADQAWEKVRMTNTVHTGLESECDQLQDHLTHSQSERDVLLTACSLLAGAFYPLYARTNVLSCERNILDQHAINCDSFKKQAAELVTTLGMELGDSLVGQQYGKRSPLLRFRAAVIAVLAANRLNYFQHYCSRMFLTYSTSIGINPTLVSTGGMTSSKKPFKGVRSSHHYNGVVSGGQRAEMGALAWLTSKEFLTTITDAMAEVRDVIDHMEKGGRSEHQESRALVASARNSFMKLTEKLQQYFHSTQLTPYTGMRDKNSLIRLLGLGLQKLLHRIPLEQKLHIISSQHTMSSLQHHLLDFTQRLHTAEVDRKNLRADVSRLRQENQLLAKHRNTAESLQGELESMKQQHQQMAPLDKFESLCSELDSALKREQQAQQLLNEQSQQLQEFSMQLERRMTEGSEKDQTLTEAVQGLNEARMEVKRKEQSMHQLEKERSQHDNERRRLQENLHDAENALRTAARDKDFLAEYIRSVESALGKIRHNAMPSHGGSGRDLSLLLSADLLPPDCGKTGPELRACQDLVAAFVDVHQMALSRLAAFEDELESHKRHVVTLKKELNAAVRREFQDELELQPDLGMNGMNERSFTRNRSMYDPMGRASQQAFAPLVEDTEASYSMLQPQSPRSPRSHGHPSSIGSAHSLGSGSPRSSYGTPTLARPSGSLRTRVLTNSLR